MDLVVQFFFSTFYFNLFQNENRPNWRGQCKKCNGPFFLRWLRYVLKSDCTVQCQRLSRAYSETDRKIARKMNHVMWHFASMWITLYNYNTNGNINSTETGIILRFLVSYMYERSSHIVILSTKCWVFLYEIIIKIYFDRFHSFIPFQSIYVHLLLFVMLRMSSNMTNVKVLWDEWTTARVCVRAHTENGWKN